MRDIENPGAKTGAGEFRACIEIMHPRADELLATVDADNTPQVRCSAAGGILRCEITVDGMGTLLATLDDLLACIDIAEKVFECSDGSTRPPVNGGKTD